jgi:hypothetical protein
MDGETVGIGTCGNRVRGAHRSNEVVKRIEAKPPEAP